MVFTGHQRQLLENGADPAPALGAGHFQIQQRQLDVFENGQLVDEVETLEDEADVSLAQMGPFFFGISGYLFFPVVSR
jgi:hypothetical protein